MLKLSWIVKQFDSTGCSWASPAICYFAKWNKLFFWHVFSSGPFIPLAQAYAVSRELHNNPRHSDTASSVFRAYFKLHDHHVCLGAFKTGRNYGIWSAALVKTCMLGSLSFLPCQCEWVTVLFLSRWRRNMGSTPRLNSSGNITQEEERERAPPCGEATAVHLNEKVKGFSIATVLHSNSLFE